MGKPCGLQLGFPLDRACRAGAAQAGATEFIRPSGFRNRHMRRRPSQRRAMTLTEVVVVIAIIGVLIGLTVPAVMKAREAANRSTCQNNMKQIGVALSNYMSAFNRLPASIESRNFQRGDFGPTWAVQMLPYLGAEQIAENLKFKKPTSAAATVGIASRSRPIVPASMAPKSVLVANEYTAEPIHQLLCPSDYMGGSNSVTTQGTFSHSNYLAFVGANTYGVEKQEGAFGSIGGRTYAEFRDGTSHTVMVGEYLTGVPQSEAPYDLRGVFWLDRPGSSQIYGSAPPNSRVPDLLPTGHCYNRPSRNLPCEEAVHDVVDSAASRSRHPGGVNVLLADGSTRFVSNKINPDTWKALVTVAGGDQADEDAKPTEAPKKVKKSKPHQEPTYLRDRFVIALRDDANISDAQIEKWSQSGVRLLYRYNSRMKSLALHVPPEMTPVVFGHPAVKRVEKDVLFFTTAQTIPPGIARVGATQSTVRAGKGSGPPVNATIAVFDTGIDEGHPDLNVTRTLGFGYYGGGDGNGHGTHVSGTAAAIDNDIGVVGVAPGARLIGLKVLGPAGSGSQADILAGVSWAIANASEIDVANMSLGISQPVTTVNNAVDQLVDAGVVVVVAAGNSSSQASLNSPAGAGKVITVGAFYDSDGRPGGLGPPTPDFDAFGNPILLADDSWAPFSCFGEKVSVVAPGVNVLSTFPGGGYGSISGTSMASPHVAGAVALLMGQQPLHDTPQARLRNVRFNGQPKQEPNTVRKRLAQAYSGFILGPADDNELFLGPGGYTRKYLVVNVSGF